MNHIISIVIDVLMLLDLFRVFDHHIGLQVKLRSIQRSILALLHGDLKVFLHLVLKVAVDWMMVEVLPLDALVWVDYQHAADDVLGHFRDLVDFSWEF